MKILDQRAQCMVMAAVTLLMSLAGAPIIAATDEPLPISKIVEDMGEYHLTMVTLRGTVRQVNALEPYYIPSGVGCYGAYTFRLEDESGSLLMAVPGICGQPILRQPPITDGDRVIVWANIQAPDRLGSFQEVIGPAVPDAATAPIQAIASRITKDSDGQGEDEP